MLSEDEMALLEAIEQAGSLSRAAARLGKAPSTISHAARQLEARFDALLFDRRRYRLQLTPAGRLLTQESARLSQDMARLTRRVKQVAGGWEDRLSIVTDEILEVETLLPLVQSFDKLDSGVQLRLTHEVLGGTWEALREGRADLVVGATSAPPAIPQLRWAELGAMDWVFAVAPRHPLARVPEPLAQEQVQPHRAVVVADTARRSDARSYGLLGGQAVLAVPTMRRRCWPSATGWASAGCRAIAWPPCSSAASWWRRRLRIHASPIRCTWPGAASTRAAHWHGGWRSSSSRGSHGAWCRACRFLPERARRPLR